ncbi:Fatty acyl-CoA reductase 3 [Morella rubra]|uniref:Fatty acyl-CoA reductase n=1 Tax=Morella rubra TaxID=262757 RepID=A0A6A1WPS4_9ROSI|nr:Fatty acyl-CoA reductase 3 [Morella rubra]
MELGSIVQLLENKAMLVTGATGFLGKIFVEKILGNSELFRVLKEKWGPNFSSSISQKVTVLPGDLCLEDMGLKDSMLREEMRNQVDFVINLAAATNFDERYDVALDLNTFEAKHGKEVRMANTYVFTKAMGEMLIGHLKENMSVAIIRPTIVTSTFKEPFPGWVEGFRTIDSLLGAYGKGKLTCFPCDLKGILDLIPADMVVNAIIVSMAAHANQPSDAIYQVGSSARNPTTNRILQEASFRYFSQKPWIDRDGHPVKVRKALVLGDMKSFRRYMAIRYLLLLKGLKLANVALCQYFRGRYLNLRRKINIVMRLVDLYKPYLFFKGVFDDMNTEKLRMAVREGGTEADVFYFDPKCLDWEDYFLNTHLPGIVKYVLK